MLLMSFNLASSCLKWAKDTGQETNKFERGKEDLKHGLLLRGDNWVSHHS